MKEEILKWCRSVVKECNEYGEQVGKDYYCFQTSIPEDEAGLMIIGINPGGTGAFWKRKENDQLSQGLNIYSVKKPHPNNIPMVSKLARVFTSDYLKDALEEATAMNIYYFNTKDVNMLNASLSKEIKVFCEKKTVEAIRILNPKKILFLCIDKKTLVSVGVTDIEGIGHCMKKGTLNDKEILAIPNPGYYAAYSYDNGCEMGKVIEAYLRG